MMRFALVGMIWLTCVGGVAVYFHAREVPQGPMPLEAGPAEPHTGARFDLQITLTFKAEPDPFALDVDGSEGSAPVSMRLNDGPWLEPPTQLSPGVPWEVSELEGVHPGINELLVQAAPPIEAVPRQNAMRMRLLRDGRILRERTFWSEGGARILGTLRFDSDPTIERAEHED